MGRVSAIEAMKAADACFSADLRPDPPNLIGRKAWVFESRSRERPRRREKVSDWRESN